MLCSVKQRQTTSNEMVTKSPAHYTRGSIEVWDFIRDQQFNYHLGNAIKYICRAGYKGSKAERTSKKLSTILKMNSNISDHCRHRITFGSSDRLQDIVWDPELEGEPDYATGFDR